MLGSGFRVQICIRNPWESRDVDGEGWEGFVCVYICSYAHTHTHAYVVGPGEFDGEGWEDGGVKWEENPGAFDELGYAADPNDGMFWMEWSTATRYFWSWILILFMLDFVYARFCLY